MNVAEKNIFDSYLLLKACPGCGAIVGSYINDLFFSLINFKMLPFRKVKIFIYKSCDVFVKTTTRITRTFSGIKI
jgi:hypothetical protein